MAEVSAILTAIFGTGSQIIQKLRDQGNIANSGVIIDADRNEVEYRFDINLGNPQSRTQDVLKRITSLISKEITIEGVEEISGTGLPTNENLRQMGIIKITKRTAIIDFPQMFAKVQASLVIITLRKSFPVELIQSLVYRNISRVNRVNNDIMETSMEIVLNNASMWYSEYTSFSVRNIVFRIDMSITNASIVVAIPSDLREKLTSADKLALANTNARKFLSIFQRLILEFQTSDFLNELSSAISLDPPHLFKIDGLTTKMQGYSLSNSGLPIMMPGNISIKIVARIEDKDKAIHGTAKLDLKRYQAVLSSFLIKLREKTTNIKL